MLDKKLEDFLLHWSQWQPLQGIGKNKTISAGAGLYRVRSQNKNNLDYIGQTGRSLRERLGALAIGIYKDYMPYRDPHTASPAFWATQQTQDMELEASVCEISDVSKPHLKGLECLAIYEHRIKFGLSPSFNFGRMPTGFSNSSGNNKNLIKSGKRFRGQLITETLDCHKKGMAPLEPIKNTNKNLGQILQLNWSEWSHQDAHKNLKGFETGLYILRHKNKNVFLYVGEGKIKDRINAHLKKGQKPNHRQYPFFKDHRDIEISYAINNSLKSHHRLEIENDLIGAYLKKFNDIPRAQFIG